MRKATDFISTFDFSMNFLRHFSSEFSQGAAVEHAGETSSGFRV